MILTIKMRSQIQAIKHTMETITSKMLNAGDLVVAGMFARDLRMAPFYPKRPPMPINLHASAPWGAPPFCFELICPLQGLIIR